jgi:hypothetical protein
LNCMHDTEHEKIIRGLALSIAMMVYGKEESADPIIEQLVFPLNFILLLCICCLGFKSLIFGILMSRPATAIPLCDMAQCLPWPWPTVVLEIMALFVVFCT